MDALGAGVLVTGASGFVGRHLAAALTRGGVQGRGLVRTGESEFPSGFTPILVPSFNVRATLDQASAGCLAVVHLAARVHVMRENAEDPLLEFRRTNVEGTRAVLDAAIRTGVRLFIYLSSVKVHGEGREEPYTEEDVRDPQDPYAVSKCEAEDLVRSYSDRIETIILRPPLVYGPGVRGNFRRLLRLSAVARSIPLPLGGLRARRSFVYVGNLVDAVLHLLRTPQAAGRDYLISDGQDLSTADLWLCLGRAAGFSPRLVHCPPQFLNGVGRLLGRANEMARLTGPLTVDPSALLGSGWAPPFTIEQGLDRTVAWWLDIGRHE